MNPGTTPKTLFPNYGDAVMTKFGSICKYLFGYILLSSMTIASAPQALAIQFEPDTNLTFIPYDAKTYPGISCEAQAVAEIDEFMNLSFDMFNANPGKRNVVCPIVRDNTKNPDGTLGVYINVYNVANRTLECWLYSSDRFGLIIDSDTSSTSNSGDQTIYVSVDDSVERGFYAISCELANGAAIRSYEVREFLDTDDDNSSLALP